ncbi:hypothetical protein L1049_025616 [Liquidambar formosana]|uniref:Uncharacterized protein n=1 Tax=Liquidambar formosana TaxID=63359 RepID=A0AAP0R6N8_LIQFO
MKLETASFCTTGSIKISNGLLRHLRAILYRIKVSISCHYRQAQLKLVVALLVEQEMGWGNCHNSLFLTCIHLHNITHLCLYLCPQTCYSSSPYPDQLSSTTAAQQVQLQLPPYLSPSFGPPHLSPPASTKQQQQQQQRIWAAQLATLYRPGGTTSPMAQFPSWQSGRQDSPLLAQCAQAMLPPSPSSLEVLGPKYISISPQQHQFMAITSSLPPVSSSFITKTAPKVKRQHHHLPSGFEENGGGFHSDGALPLQLLCNEHL